MPDEHSLFELLAKLDLTIGGMRQEAELKRRLDEQAKLAQTPKMVGITGTVILSSAGFGVIEFDLQGPEQGWYWNVRKLVVGGLSPTTTTAGRADVFVTAEDLTRRTSLAEIGLVSWRDQATSLPLVADYGNGELRVIAGQKLYVIVSGGTASQQVVCAGDVESFQEAASLQVVAR